MYASNFARQNRSGVFHSFITRNLSRFWTDTISMDGVSEVGTIGTCTTQYYQSTWYHLTFYLCWYIYHFISTGARWEHRSAVYIPPSMLPPSTSRNELVYIPAQIKRRMIASPLKTRSRSKIFRETNYLAITFIITLI